MLQIEYLANWSLEWKQKYKVKCLDPLNSEQAHWKGLLKKTKSLTAKRRPANLKTVSKGAWS